MGQMGNPLYGDDEGKMCYNAAKSWQIGWYDDRKRVINPKTENVVVKMVGIADYLESETDTLPVVLKLETDTNDDYFIAFNRARGVNSQNDEADNEVSIVQAGANGQYYSLSSLKEHLVEGQQETITNFGGVGKDIIVRVESIDDTSSVWTADVYIGDGTPVISGPTPPPTPCPGTTIDVDIQTDNYPQETSWTLTNACTSEVVAAVAQGDYEGRKAQMVSASYCVPQGRYTFIINDSYGDGICCGYGNGSYEVRMGSNIKASGGAFGGTESTTFGAAQCTQPTPPPTPPVSLRPSLELNVSLDIPFQFPHLFLSRYFTSPHLHPRLRRPLRRLSSRLLRPLHHRPLL